MRAQLIPLAELAGADIARWRELAARAIEPNPFFEADAALAAAGSIGGEGVGLLVCGERSGPWQACAPVEAGRGWRRVPIRTRASWLHTYCFLGTPLVAGDDPEAALDALLRGALDAGGVSYLGFDLLGGDGPVSAALDAAGPRAGARRFDFLRTERAALHRGTEHLGLNRKHQRELARVRRRLAEHLGAEIGCEDRAGSDRAVDDFLRLERSGWKGEGGTAFASDPRHEAFFRELCGSFATTGRLQLLALHAGERVVAMKCNLLAADTAFCFKIAYDDGLAGYSPGIQLELENIALFDAHPSLILMDSCAHPANEMINRLWKGRRQIRATTFSAGIRGALVRPALRGASIVRGLLR